MDAIQAKNMTKGTNATAASNRRSERRQGFGGFALIAVSRRHRKTGCLLKEDAIGQGRFESPTTLCVASAARFRIHR